MDVAVGTWKEDIFYPLICAGQNPTVCEAGVVYSKGKAPCILGILSGDPTLYNQCSVIYFKDLDQSMFQELIGPNTFLVYAGATAYKAHYRCAGQSSQIITVPAGLLIIEVDENCNLDTDQWMIQGIRTICIHLPQHKMPIFQIANLTLPADMINMTVRLYEATPLKQVKITNLEDVKETVLSTVPPIRHHGTPLWIWVVVSVAIAIITFLIVYCFCGCPSKKPLKSKDIVKFNVATEKVSIEPSEETVPE